MNGIIDKPVPRGFSLLEVLIALFVVSIGLLGLARLQAQTTASLVQTRLRTQAQLLLQDLAERVRLNANIAVRYGLPVAPYATTLLSVDNATCPAASSADHCASLAQPCSLAQWATVDSQQIACRIAALSSSMSLTLHSSAQGRMLLLRWPGSMTGHSSASCTLTGKQENCVALPFPVTGP